MESLIITAIFSLILVAAFEVIDRKSLRQWVYFGVFILVSIGLLILWIISAIKSAPTTTSYYSEPGQLIQSEFCFKGTIEELSNSVGWYKCVKNLQTLPRTGYVLAPIYDDVSCDSITYFCILSQDGLLRKYYKNSSIYYELKNDPDAFCTKIDIVAGEIIKSDEKDCKEHWYEIKIKF